MSLTFSKKEYANANKLQQDHPCVIELIRKFFLHKPASPDVALNLKFPNHKNPSARLKLVVVASDQVTFFTSTLFYCFCDDTECRRTYTTFTYPRKGLQFTFRTN